MATNFSPCKGSYVLNQFPSNVMFGMNGFHVSASGAIQGHHGPLVIILKHCRLQAHSIWKSLKFVVWERDKDYTTCNSSHITNRQVFANHNSIFLKEFLHEMFVFHQFLFMKPTYPVSILGRAIAILTQCF